MNKCIYLKNRNSDDLTFVKHEHIIPAALGGIKTLPIGYVSDEINEFFSKELELSFTRRSTISLFRSFDGPGHRGNLSDKKAVKSPISIIKSDSDTNILELGYIQKGKPYSLAQVIIDKKNTSKYNFSLPLNANIDTLLTFKRFTGKYTLLKSTEIESGKVLLGYDIYKEKGKGKDKIKWYLGINKSDFIPTDLLDDFTKNLDKIIQSYLDNSVEMNKKNFQPKFNLELSFNMDDFFRVYAKTAFNFLAYTFGQEIALLDCFDPIRKWIISGGKNKFVSFSENQEISFTDVKTLRPYLNNKSHCILIDIYNNTLYALVSFYGEAPKKIILSDNISNYENYFLSRFMSMLICNWEEREEYTLLEKLNSVLN